MTVTRRDLLDLNNACVTLEHLPVPPAFALWITDVREALADAVAEMRTRGKVPEATALVYADYESARIALLREHAKLDPRTQQPVVDADGHFVLDDHTQTDAALQALRQDDRWREAYEAVVRQKAEWGGWMAEPAADALVRAIPALAMDMLPPTLTAELIKPLKPFLRRGTTPPPPA